MPLLAVVLSPANYVGCDTPDSSFFVAFVTLSFLSDLIELFSLISSCSLAYLNTGSWTATTTSLLSFELLLSKKTSLAVGN